MKNFLKALAVALLIASTPSFGMFNWFKKKPAQPQVKVIDPYIYATAQEKLAFDLESLPTEDLLKIKPIKTNASTPEEAAQYNAFNEKLEYLQNSAKARQIKLQSVRTESERLAKIQQELAAIRGKAQQEFQTLVDEEKALRVNVENLRQQLEGASKEQLTIIENQLAQLLARLAFVKTKIDEYIAKSPKVKPTKEIPNLPAGANTVILKTADNKEVVISNFEKSRASLLNALKAQRRPSVNQQISVPASSTAINLLLKALNGDYRLLQDRGYLVETLNAALDLQAPTDVETELINRYVSTIADKSEQDRIDLINSEIISRRTAGTDRQTRYAQQRVLEALNKYNSARPSQSEQREPSAWERFKNFFRRN